MSNASAESLVLLTTAANNVEAASIRSLLEAEGIEVLVHGENHRALEGAFGVYIELRVMVRQRDLDEARELLEEIAYAEHLPPEAEPAAGEVDASIHRFNADRPDTGDDAPTSGPTLYPAIAFILALAVPLGTGHLYARRWVTGAMLGGLLAWNYVLFARGWDVTLAVLGLIAIDATGGVLAVRSRNARSLGEAKTPALS